MSVGTIGRGKLLLRCGVLGGARRFGAHRGRRGVGHIVDAARLQLVCIGLADWANVSYVPDCLESLSAFLLTGDAKLALFKFPT